MPKLEKYQKYSRSDIHQIFKVENPFDQIWKMWGIINLGKYKKEMDGDFIFFVTIGSSVDGKEWDEGITSNGVVSWQSQNQNSLTSPNTLKFIKHDEQINNIYYFYRQNAVDLYKYLGKLKYLNHDKENPSGVVRIKNDDESHTVDLGKDNNTDTLYEQALIELTGGLSNTILPMDIGTHGLMLQEVHVVQLLVRQRQTNHRREWYL